MIDYIINTVNQFFVVLGEATTNPSPILAAWDLFSFLFWHGGWIIIIIVIYEGAKFGWVDYLATRHAERRQWVLLAIDVPRDNVQSPLAVENIFSHLAGAHANPDKLDTYWKGWTPEYFSMEIVGIEGYVQFLIRTPVNLRDLVEASVYAQYPEAQITEVEDYTTGYPSHFPDERYDMYGTEFVLTADQAYPIRTYVEFEHRLTQELKDPLTTLLETFNKLGPGEQIWLQLIVVPTDESWKGPASKLIRKIMGLSTASGPTVFGGVMGELGRIASEAQSQALGAPGGTAEPAKKQSSSQVMLPSDDAAKVDGIGRKIKKIGFLIKYRLIYIAPKENFKPVHGREAVIGAIKQFNTGDLNALKPDTKTVGVHAHYVLVDYRKNLKKSKLMMRYKSRSHYGGRERFILNTEELATLWHFPLKTETSPIRHMVQRTEFKHTPPPTSLPVVDEIPHSATDKVSEVQENSK